MLVISEVMIKSDIKKLPHRKIHKNLEKIILIPHLIITFRIMIYSFIEDH